MFTLTKTDVHAVAFGVGEQPDLGHCLRSGASKADKHESTTYVAQPVPYDFFQITAPVNRQNRKPGDPCHTLARDNAAHATLVQTMQVRRLTPVECERLQGFPDGYTNIPWRNKPESPDGPRYKALGNSMAVPVMSWIGERINEVSKL
jgi:DNA (cytosine-5)-methyltransferase 1